MDRLFRAAWALCGRREDAEDLVQETYALVLARPRWLRRDDDLGYLLRVLRNTHVSRLRATGGGPPRCRSTITPRPSATWSRGIPRPRSTAGALFAAIAQLPAAFREALVAVDVVGLSYREAGAALGVRRVHHHHAAPPRPGARGIRAGAALDGDPCLSTATPAASGSGRRSAPRPPR